LQLGCGTALGRRDGFADQLFDRDAERTRNSRQGRDLDAPAADLIGGDGLLGDAEPFGELHLGDGLVFAQLRDARTELHEKGGFFFAQGHGKATTVYDEAGHWLGEYGGAGAAIQQAVWLDDLPVGVMAGGQLHYIEADALGSPRVVIEPQRNVAVWRRELAGEAFGNAAPDQDPDGDAAGFVFNLRFPGQRYDAASGLNYNYYRDYESGTGRYFEVDPLLHSQPLSWGAGKPYAYVELNPSRFTDPFGLFTWDPSCDACGTGGMNQQWRNQIESDVGTVCQKIDQLVTNVRRAKCIKKVAKKQLLRAGPAA